MENLIIIVAIVLVLIISFYLVKNRTLIKLRQMWSNDKKIHIENLLKQLYDYEYNRKQATLDSIAGAMAISRNNTAELIAKSEAMKLSKSNNGIIELTSEGRSYALRIIRIHRVWERYLADETSYKEIDWHENAEDEEHNISIHDANKLAAKIGNPLFDPHGDPIPSADGFMPELKGKLMTELEEGEIATIVHIEDEPLAIYAQIMALGLYSGMQIQVLERTSDKIKFVKDGEDAILAPIFANNILVKVDEVEKLKIENLKTLSKLNLGESAKVIAISGNCRGRQRRRLMDFGILPGTVITAEMMSPLGDPKAYNVRGTKIAIRKNQADLIFIEEELVNG